MDSSRAATGRSGVGLQLEVEVMTRRILLALAALALMGSELRAQVSFDRRQIPTRTALEHVGLERHWMGVVPVAGSERVISLNLSDRELFAMTSSGFFHVFEAETGRYLWSKDLGIPVAMPLPASVVDDLVIVAIMNQLYCLDRVTGREIWKADLGKPALSPTSADEDYAYVGLIDGKVLSFALRDQTADDTRRGLVVSAGKQVWAWKTNGPVSGRIISTDRLVAFGSQDGRAVVAVKRKDSFRPIEQLFRYRTNGPISASLSELGTRTLLVPSEDGNLYSIDLFTGKTNWIFASGAPIKDDALVAQGEIFVRNSLGQFSSLDPETGNRHWTADLGQGHFLAAGAKRLYILSSEGALGIGDRATGTIIAGPRATLAAGLNLSDYTVTLANRQNDRIYLCTPSGLVLCLREAGQLTPVPIRETGQTPFGTLPGDEPIPTPPPSPAVGAPAEPAPGDVPAPAPDDTMEPDDEPPADDDDPFGFP